MLSFLFNEKNVPEEILKEEIRKEFPEGIGLSRSLAKEKKEALAALVPVLLYDSELTLDGAEEGEVTAALSEAAFYGAEKVLLWAGSSCDRNCNEGEFLEKLIGFRKLAEEKGRNLLLTNRKVFDPQHFMSFEKFLRLSVKAGVKIAHDLGYSHAQASALENYYDFEKETELLLISDNYGREANNNPDWCTQEIMVPGEMRQPGYGTLPIVGIMQRIRKDHPDMPVYVNGTRYRDADLTLVMLETRTLLGGRVFISPAMARKGRNEEGRLLI